MHEAASKLKFERDVGVLTPTFLRNRGWTVNEKAYPVLDVTFDGPRPLRLRLTCDQWNELPPSAQLLNADGGDFTGPTPTTIINMGPHEITGKAFICMRGFREYHIHSGHVADAWDNYRNEDGNNLVGMLDQVCHAWRKG